MLYIYKKKPSFLFSYVIAPQVHHAPSPLFPSFIHSHPLPYRSKQWAWYPWTICVPKFSLTLSNTSIYRFPPFGYYTALTLFVFNFISYDSKSNSHLIF